MAQYTKLATTSRTCGPVQNDQNSRRIDEAAKAYILEVVEAVRNDRPDLLVLPEMCDLPEGMAFEAYVEYAQARDETLLEAVKEIAKTDRMWIAYPTLCKAEDGRLRNSCLLVDRNGQIACRYDKTNLTQGELEAGLLPGLGPVVHECELGRLGFAICFDLNYSELAYEYKKSAVNLIVFPSLFHGGVMQSLWAFTSRSYLAASGGGCAGTVVAPTGELCATTTHYYAEVTHQVNLDYQLLHLDFNKDKVQQAKAKYGSLVAVHNPDNFPAVLLASNMQDRSTRELIKEFGLEPLDEYLARMALNNKNAKDRVNYGG